MVVIKTEITACLDIHVGVISNVIMQKSVQRCRIATHWLRVFAACMCDADSDVMILYQGNQ